MKEVQFGPMKRLISAVALVATLLALPAWADGPLTLDLAMPVELSATDFTYASRQVYNAGHAPLLVVVELIDMEPRWFATVSPWSAELEPGESLAISVAAGLVKDGDYSARLRVRAVPAGYELPPLYGESYFSVEERERLESNVIQTLHVPVYFVAE